MKILRIINWGYESGGAENYVFNTKVALEQRGHVVRVFAATDQRPTLPHFNEYSFRGVGVLGLGRFFYYVFNPYAYFALKKVLAEFKPDVIDLQTMSQASPSILFLLRKYPVIATVHGAELFTKGLLMYSLPLSDFKHSEYDLKDLRLIGRLRCFYIRYIAYPFYWVGLKNVDVFITLSRYMQRMLRQEKVESVYVPMGATLSSFKPLTEAEISHNLIYVGRLEKYKGVDYLILALSKIVLQFQNARLFIAGDGDFKNELQTLVASLKLQRNVIFLGHLNRQQLVDVYHKSSVVIMPSIWPEPFGLVGVEAMSIGRPVIASDVGGISDWLIDGETGFLVPPKDAVAIAVAVSKLFSDPALVLRMGVAGRKKSEEFDIQKHVSQMEKIYEDLLTKYQK